MSSDHWKYTTTTRYCAICGKYITLAMKGTKYCSKRCKLDGQYQVKKLKQNDTNQNKTQK